MTKEQIERLNLGVELDTMTELIISTGVDWMKENTTINTEDIDNFPNCAKLFLIKFCDIQNLQTGVSSESIQGLSHSFTTDKNSMIWQLAESLLGGYLNGGQVRFVAASSRWQ